MRTCSIPPPRKKGIALPLVLVTLLVGGALVGAGFFVVTNFFYSSKGMVDSARLYSAAMDGLERGKLWIRLKGSQEGRLPRWDAPNTLGILEPGEINTSETPKEKGYQRLLAMPVSGDAVSYENPQVHYSSSRIEIKVRIYDMDYTPGGGLDSKHLPGFPPKLRVSETGINSENQASTYAGSNRGEGTAGTGAGGMPQYGFYLIRSTAEFDGKSTTVEQAVIVRL